MNDTADICDQFIGSLIARPHGVLRRPASSYFDFKPVVKFFTPDAQCTWLLTELDPGDGLAFGLCDLGISEPELGYVSLAELAGVRGKLGLPVERDLHFEADKSISAYAAQARELRRIVA